MTIWLDFAKDQPGRRKQVFMKDWEYKLGQFACEIDFCYQNNSSWNIFFLRSSGLGIVRNSKKFQRLVLNEPVLQAWNNLNAEEQYCTLLESWLIRGNPGIIGEKTFPGGPWILECRQFLKRIPKHGLDTIEQNSLNTIRFTVGLHGVALLRFFGLLSLEEFKPEQGKGWNRPELSSPPGPFALEPFPRPAFAGTGAGPDPFCPDRHLDHIPDPDLIFQEQKKPADHILDQVLGTEADGQAEDASGGQDGTDLQAHFTQNDDAPDSQDDDRQDKLDNGCQGIGPFLEFLVGE